jgi:hypothetical protein
METKKVGIACDDYKLAKFKEELNAAGFTQLTEHKLTENSYILTVEVPVNKVGEVHRLCKRVQTYFHNRN